MVGWANSEEQKDKEIMDSEEKKSIVGMPDSNKEIFENKTDKNKRKAQQQLSLFDK
jgi:hypothetical protein